MALRGARLCWGLAACLALLCAPAWAEQALRIAFWNIGFERKGPGLLLRDIMRGKEAQIAASAQALDALNADVLVLSGFDFDMGGLALGAFNARLARPYAHLRALRPNSGVQSGHDLDGDGRGGEAEDALAYGRFPGQGAMAVLSRFAFDAAAAQDFSHLLWRDMPDAHFPDALRGAADILPLSSNGHYVNALVLPDGRRLYLLTWHAGTPGFNRLGDENIRRNHDENALWLRFLEGALPEKPPNESFVLIGQANSDPDKGSGDPAAITALLAHPLLQNPQELAQDTSYYGGTIGALRAAYILPSRDLKVLDGGITAPPDGARHALLWLDLADKR